jgi:hypothetical protein
LQAAGTEAGWPPSTCRSKDGRRNDYRNVSKSYTGKGAWQGQQSRVCEDAVAAEQGLAGPPVPAGARKGAAEVGRAATVTGLVLLR